MSNQRSPYLFRLICAIGVTGLLHACQSPPSLATEQPLSPLQARAHSLGASTLAGDWIMHLYVGKTHFADELRLTREASGQLSGSLTVPGNFTAPLEHVQVTGRTLSFEIMAPEGPKPFRVSYHAQLDERGTTMVGFATTKADGTLLGGFVGQKQTEITR